MRDNRRLRVVVVCPSGMVWCHPHGDLADNNLHHGPDHYSRLHANAYGTGDGQWSSLDAVFVRRGGDVLLERGEVLQVSVPRVDWRELCPRLDRSAMVEQADAALEAGDVVAAGNWYVRIAHHYYRTADDLIAGIRPRLQAAAAPGAAG